MTFNDKPLYPYTYINSSLDGGNITSNFILKLINDPKFKNSLKSTFLLMIIIVSYSLPAKATDLDDGAKLVNELLGSKGAEVAFKEVVQGALKLDRSKPSLIAATTLVCGASYPIPPAPTNWALSVACKILIAETLR